MLIDHIYAYQLSPGEDKTLVFAATAEDAIKDAKAHRRELHRQGVALKLPTAIYKIWLKPLTRETLIDLLNAVDEPVAEHLVASKEAVTVVSD